MLGQRVRRVARHLAVARGQAGLLEELRDEVLGVLAPRRAAQLTLPRRTVAVEGVAVHGDHGGGGRVLCAPRMGCWGCGLRVCV